MTRKSDGVTRREFVGGLAMGVAAGTSLTPVEAIARGLLDGSALPSDYYPPKLTGLRGNHAGSFETAHGVAWDGKRYDHPIRRMDDVYDLVIVGGGISGLAAAWYYRRWGGKDLKILILDNHDDFGGHAKRNEFTVGDKRLIGYGGSQSVQEPGHYSTMATWLMQEIGFEKLKFYDHFDADFYKDHGLGSGIFFDRETFGEDKLVKTSRGFMSTDTSRLEDAVREMPISDQSKADYLRLHTAEKDYLGDMPADARKRYLQKISYVEYLKTRVKVTDEVINIFHNQMKGLWGLGFDALSALEAFRLYRPGFTGLGLSEADRAEGALPNMDDSTEDEPYIFHFPEGNAGVARLLVRSLIPQALPGSTQEDMVTARLRYEKLDHRDNGVRIRLNSMAVNVTHTANGDAVDVTYLEGGRVKRVQGKKVILACYNNIIPHICPEVGDDQREALKWAQKVPLCYTNVALTNWRAWQQAGVSRVHAPNGLYHGASLDFPVSMGDYHFAKTPDDPILVHMTYVPTVPGETCHEQHRLGRHEMLAMTFDDYEEAIHGQMNAIFGAYGFDWDKDVAGITVNRWPHGYAYEYNELFDPLHWSPDYGPHITGRRQIGNISIANSDSQAYAYVNGAIDAAYRAVQEQLT